MKSVACSASYSLISSFPHEAIFRKTSVPNNNKLRLGQKNDPTIRYKTIFSMEVSKQSMFGNSRMNPFDHKIKHIVRAVVRRVDVKASKSPEKLMNWLTSNGAENRAADVSEGVVTATKTVSPGDLLFAVPEKLSVTSYDVAQHDLVSELAVDVDDYVGLTLWLLAERARGDNSKWREYVASLPDAVNTPILWSDDEREVLLKGSPTLELAKSRSAAIDAEFASLEEKLQLALRDFPPEARSLEAFRKAFSVVLSRVVYLPSVEVLALVPLLDSCWQSGAAGAALDYDLDFKTVTLRADRYFQPGDTVGVADNLGRANGELMLSCGRVDSNNTEDCMEWAASLLRTDPLFESKMMILESVGLQTDQVFPIYSDRMPNQLLAFLRMSRVQDPGQLAQVNFERDSIISQANEYETLMLMMSDCRDKFDAYEGNLEEEQKLLQRSSELSKKEVLAAALRLGEKSILQQTMSAIRRRLAPIRGVPTKGGKFEDPNADILEIFESIENIPNAPKKAFKSFINWASGSQDPDWK